MKKFNIQITENHEVGTKTLVDEIEADGYLVAGRYDTAWSYHIGNVTIGNLLDLAMDISDNEEILCKLFNC
ncbi:MAG: hypothetical protein SOV75_02360 [Candidatus Limiplasma sp.]|nr:hypothetical protein [Candidatus Limiplasma sp.]